MKRIYYFAMIVCGMLTLICFTQCKKSTPDFIKLTDNVVTLSSETKEAKVKVTSNVDWICSGGDKGLGIAIMTLDWIEIEPFYSKAGTTEMSIRLIENKLPTKESQLYIKLQALDGNTQATLTIKYKP